MVIETVASILTGILIAAVSSWITVRLSLRRFRTEKWWERKVLAYEKVIEALHNIKSFSEHHVTAMHRGLELSKDTELELGNRSKSANQELDKIIDTGAFLLSNESNNRLIKYKKDTDGYFDCPNWGEYIEHEYTTSSKCLSDIIDLAKHDLRE